MITQEFLVTLLTISACALYFALALMGRHVSPLLARKWMFIALGLHLAQWLLNYVLFDQNFTFVSTIKFGFSPILSATSWLVLLVYALESNWLLTTKWTIAWIGGTSVILNYFFPGQNWHPVHYNWSLGLHWLVGWMSYFLIAIAVLHAGILWRLNVATRKVEKIPTSVSILAFENLTFSMVQIGFLFVSATLILGLWLEYQYNDWRINHKSVFTFLAWLCFVVLFIGRRFYGWRAKKASKVLFIGAVFLLFSYVGAKFVLQVILNRSA